MEKNTLTIEQIEALWHQYRDEEHRLFTDREWADYKAKFKRGVNFPDWLRALDDRQPEENPVPLRETLAAMNIRAAELTGWRRSDSASLPWMAPNGRLAIGPPEPASNHGDALRLMEFTQAIRAISRGVTLPDVGCVSLRLYRDSVYIAEWSIWRGPGGSEDADDLPLCIAKACVAALENVAGEGICSPKST